ncbi:MAG: lipoyl(octanoyl) transferase LipB [Arachnia sp.]
MASSLRDELRHVTFEYRGLGGVSRLSDYQDTWDYQREVHAAVASGARPGHVVFVEHTPVYTAGRRTEQHERPFDGTPVIDVDRGGKITYHGPGQLVGYPIVTLPEGIGVVDHVRRLEEAVIRMLSARGLRTRRIDGRTGVWLDADAARPERKICAIGVRVAQRTALHGFALNVAPSTGAFANIVPCGIADAGVTSLAEELPGEWSVAAIAHDLEPFLAELLLFEPYVPSR